MAMWSQLKLSQVKLPLTGWVEATESTKSPVHKVTGTSCFCCIKRKYDISTPQEKNNATTLKLTYPWPNSNSTSVIVLTKTGENPMTGARKEVDP